MLPSTSQANQTFAYLNNTNADIRLIGFPACLNPFTQFTSASRGDMFASHISQAMILADPDFPYIYSGLEYNLSQYEFSTSRRTQAAHILAVVPKYPPRPGTSHIADNPRLLVIYKGLEDNLIHHITVDAYTLGSDGFGYENVVRGKHRLREEWTIEPNEVLTTSPAHKGSKYCLGLNANVAYMTTTDTIEDAMPVSRRFAEKCKTTRIHRKVISVPADALPLNLFGDELEYRFFPELGSKVGKDGILMAFRPVSAITFAADVAPNTLRKVNIMHDRVLHVEPGSKIIDIDVFEARSAKADPRIYGQIRKYTEATERYWMRIVEVYQECKRKNYKLAPSFNTLVNTALGRLAAMNARIPGMAGARNTKVNLIGRNGQPIEFIQLEITYVSTRKVTNGFKITDRHGAKGVVCRIVEDEDMPIDEHGFRADVIIDPASPIARMNMGQLYEQGINRMSEFVRRKVAALYDADPTAAGAMLLDYLADINPNYAALTRQRLNTKESLFRFTHGCITDGIYLNIPPFLNTITPENILLWQKKWGVEISRVRYVERDQDGNNPVEVVTQQPVCVGSKYFYLLCKLPDPTAPGVAHVSHHGAPIKPHSDMKMQHPISRTPVKLGEDEWRVMSMDVPVEECVRLMGLQANSPKALNLVIEALMTSPSPTKLNRIAISNDDINRSNSVLATAHHTMATLGIESRRTLTNLPMPTLTDGDGLEVDLDDLAEIDDETAPPLPIELPPEAEGELDDKPETPEDEAEEEEDEKNATAV